MLSKRALDVIKYVFSESSNVMLPAGVAAEIIEIRDFATVELARVAEAERPVAGPSAK